MGDLQRLMSRLAPHLPLGDRVLLSVAALFGTERPRKAAVASESDTRALADLTPMSAELDFEP